MNSLTSQAPRLPQIEHLAPGPVSDTQDYLSFYGLADLSNHAMQVLASGEQKIMVQTFEPEDTRGFVLVCHGYYDHVGIYGHLIRYLLNNNLTVIAFDQVGHGLSTGRRAYVTSFDEYLQAINVVLEFTSERFGMDDQSRLHWVGQSMGGALTMEYLHRNPSAPRGEVVLLAPLVRPYGWWFNRWVFALARLTIEERKRVITNNADNPDFIEFARSDPLQPGVLPVSWVSAMVDWFTRFEAYPPSDLAPRIIQGQADRTVAWQYNRRVLQQRYPESRWLMLPTGRHHLVNESETLRQTMWDWLDNECDWSQTEAQSAC